jgi:DNA polymerase III delta prime subunit
VSEFIRTLNLIKKHRNIDWLTPSQLQALDALKKTLHVPGTVNLCGPAGVGKTFLAWALADELGYTYFPHLKHFTQAKEIAAPGVIIDNNQPDRRSHRNALKALQFEGVMRAVLVTRELIHDYTHYVELRLSSEDRETVCRNLVSIGQFSHETEVSNLWYLVNPHLRRL